MKARVLQAGLGESFGRRRLTRAAKRARRTKSGIVNEGDQDVWRTSWRTQLPDRRKLGIRILRTVGRQGYRFAVGNRQHVALEVLWSVHLLRHVSLLCSLRWDQPAGASRVTSASKDFRRFPTSCRIP